MTAYIWISVACGAVIVIDGLRQPQSAWVAADRNRFFWLFWLGFASILALGPLALLFYVLRLRPRFAAAGGDAFRKPKAPRATQAVSGGESTPRTNVDRQPDVPPPPAVAASPEQSPQVATVRTIPPPPGPLSDASAVDVAGMQVDESVPD